MFEGGEEEKERKEGSVCLREGGIKEGKRKIRLTII